MAAEPTNLDIMVELTRVGEQLRGLTTSVNDKFDHQGLEISQLRTALTVEQDRIRRLENALAGLPDAKSTGARFKAIEDAVASQEKRGITWPQAAGLWGALATAAGLIMAYVANK